MADLINLSNQGATGEITLCMVSNLAALHSTRGGANTPLQVQAVALLRSDSELQKQFIQALYEG